jgi:hypothetical protein
MFLTVPKIYSPVKGQHSSGTMSPIDRKARPLYYD